MTSSQRGHLCVPQAQRGPLEQTEGMCTAREGQPFSLSPGRQSGDLGPGLGVRPQETPPWSPAALHSAGGWSPGHEGQEGDLHEDVPPEDKSPEAPALLRAQRQSSGHAHHGLNPSPAAPPHALHRCGPPALPAGSGHTGPWAGPARNPERSPGTASGWEARGGVLPSHPVSPLSSRLRGLL